MAETLTFDNEQATEVLTEEEQDSLQLGEELQEAQEELLAGKYKNAEDLEQAYIELQKKLGENASDTTDEVEETEPESTDEPVLGEGAQLITDASAEYWENGEELSEETLDKFSSMSSKDLVEAYVEYAKQNPQNSTQVAELSEGDVNRVQNSVGGEDTYNTITQWASENLDQQSVQAFDEVINSGNMTMINMAVQGLKAQYQMDQGYEGTLASGKAPKSSGAVFRSQAELVSAMDDVRYDRDPAYRADVLDKLDRSDISF